MVLLLGEERQIVHGKSYSLPCGGIFKGHLEGAESYIQLYFESNGLIDIVQMRKQNKKGEGSYPILAAS